MSIDTHCHLDAAEFAADRDDLVRSARTIGVSGMLIPAIGPGNFAAVRDCCARYPGCHPAYGIHPLFLDQAGEAGIVLLRQWLDRELPGDIPPVAVGEIGLDFFAPGFDAVRQEHFFVQQLKMARDLDLPVVLHIRRAADQVLKCLRRVGVKGGFAHAFNGSRQQAERFIRLGFKLGFGGAMTYPGSLRIRELAIQLPLDSIVLETDAPDISPVWLAGHRNTPQELMRIAQTFANLRCLPLAQVLQATKDNAESIIKGRS